MIDRFIIALILANLTPSFEGEGKILKRGATAPLYPIGAAGGRRQKEGDGIGLKMKRKSVSGRQ